MSTRGLYGIRKNGIDKATYNHFDSYPEALGMDVVKFCMDNDADSLDKFFDLIELVDGYSNPTDEQIVECMSAGYVDISVNEQSIDDWYCLLRGLQGNFNAYQNCIDNDAKVYMKDDIGFIKDSLFCEYAYIINLDDNVLEFYIGFQCEPQEGNRYGMESTYEGHDGTKYYPCKLLKTFTLCQEEWNADAIVREMIEAVFND